MLGSLTFTITGVLCYTSSNLVRNLIFTYHFNNRPLFSFSMCYSNHLLGLETPAEPPTKIEAPTGQPESNPGTNFHYCLSQQLTRYGNPQPFPAPTPRDSTVGPDSRVSRIYSRVRFEVGGPLLAKPPLDQALSWPGPLSDKFPQHLKPVMADPDCS